MYNTEIDKLLGEPIQKEIESHTGIEVSFDTVSTICSGAHNARVFCLNHKYILKHFLAQPTTKLSIASS